MTKEELIALSDLNREDNIKYISSEAQGIAIALDSDRYAPTLCKLERAYICGRRKSEEQIEQLEKENAELKDDNKVMADNYSKMEQKFYDNLTKAKEIIKDLLGSENTSCEEEMFFEIRQKAEQFLSEVEK